MKVNVGCGHDPWGNVRLDISKTVPRWLGKKATANLIADARFLPFRNKCFEELRSYHVLEHIEDWEKALSECRRVSSKLNVRVPVVSNMPKMECMHTQKIMSVTGHVLGLYVREIRF